MRCFFHDMTKISATDTSDLHFWSDGFVSHWQQMNQQGDEANKKIKLISDPISYVLIK